MSDEKSTVILTIDDEEIIRISFRDFLEDYEYTIFEAENGRVGLELFERERPDLVLVDLRMPEVDGIQVLGEVTERSPDTPVIVVSGTGVIGDVVEALRMGAWDYLLKPIEDMSVLLHAVEKALERARLLKANRSYQEHLEAEVARRTTELERTTEELRKSVHKYQLLAENLKDVVLSVSPGGILTYCSPAVKEMSGYDADRLIGRSLGDYFADKEEKTRAFELIREMASERTPGSMEFLFKPEGREPFPVEISAKPVVRNGGVEALHCVMRDITERRLAEAEKAELEKQLRQSQKMEAIGQLAGGVAHDFNNLLQVIHGYSELASITLSPEEDTYAKLQQVKNAARRATNLVRQLLAFSRRDAMEPIDLILDMVIDNVIKMLRRVIGEQIELSVSHGMGMNRVRADPGQIEQILMNLCVNARDAMPGGGKISIDTKRTVIDPAFCHQQPWAREGSYVLVSVTDTGFGVSPENKERIFEPFFTTKEADKGTGLGLATVYGIVKKHDGLIDMQSKMGHGTTFRIYLPAIEQAAEPVELEATDRTIRGGDEMILVAEDDEMVRDLTVQILEKAGYKLLVARDGREAIGLYEAHADEVTLSLLDVIMPKESGRAVHDRIKEITPGARVLFCSAYGMDTLESDSLPEGSWELLTKPYGPAELLHKVRTLIEEE